MKIAKKSIFFTEKLDESGKTVYVMGIFIIN